MKVGVRLGLSFGAMIAIFLTVSGVVLINASKQAEVEAWNAHTHNVLSMSENMLQGMLNMSTGSRGYLLGGEDSYLEPWTEGRKSFESSWAQAKKLTAGNPAQQKRLDSMKQR